MNAYERAQALGYATETAAPRAPLAQEAYERAKAVELELLAARLREKGTRK